MIEARSCERFKVLSENIKDPELAKFYRDSNDIRGRTLYYILALPENILTMLMLTTLARMD
jgi:tRNA isopentenyl-2-thiomethyl-A-37 hydroxylase MiaE